MQTLAEKVMKADPPAGLFDWTLVRALFPGTSEGARKQLVHRAVARGDVLRLSPGVFLLERAYRRADPHLFVIASVLHPPSHVSLQTAMAYHGLIPEAVFQVASVTAGRSRSFDTPLGRFVFQRVPAAFPRAGVEVVRVGRDQWAFVATPLRAIADLVYLTRSVTWARDGLAFLTESLRIEPDDLAEIPRERSDEICESLRSRRVIEYLTGLTREVGG